MKKYDIFVQKNMLLEHWRDMIIRFNLSINYIPPYIMTYTGVTRVMTEGITSPLNDNFFTQSTFSRSIKTLCTAAESNMKESTESIATAAATGSFPNIGTGGVRLKQAISDKRVLRNKRSVQMAELRRPVLHQPSVNM